MDTRLLKMVLVTTAIRLTLAQAFISDPALAIVHQLDMVPYGVLWQATNPFYWIGAYPQIMALVSIGPTIINYRLLSRRWYYAWLFTDLHWYTGFFSNTSVTWFSAYPVIGIAWTLLQKLPIGYWPILSNSHVTCALACGGNWSLSRGGRWVTYGLISIWTVTPTAIWARKKWLSRRPASSAQ